MHVNRHLLGKLDASRIHAFRKRQESLEPAQSPSKSYHAEIERAAHNYDPSVHKVQPSANLYILADIHFGLLLRPKSRHWGRECLLWQFTQGD